MICSVLRRSFTAAHTTLSILRPQRCPYPEQPGLLHQQDARVIRCQRLRERKPLGQHMAEVVRRFSRECGEPDDSGIGTFPIAIEVVSECGKTFLVAVG